LACPFFAVEEPIGVGDYRGLAHLGAAVNAGIILDESFLRREQFGRLHPLPGPWIVNLRVSKMVGLLRALAIVGDAGRLNVPIVIGCQVGETSLLTRAALTPAEVAGGARVLGREGAFGTLLLARDVVENPLTFGAGGRLDTAPYRLAEAAGFGLHVSEPD